MISELEELMAKLRCAGCGRRPEEIDGYLYLTVEEYAPPMPPGMLEYQYTSFMAAHWAAATAEQRINAVRSYVANYEGTLNRTTGAFACDTCYIIAGAPSSREGWTVPDSQTWPNSNKLFEDFARHKGMTVPTNRENASDSVT